MTFQWLGLRLQSPWLDQGGAHDGSGRLGCLSERQCL